MADEKNQSCDRKENGDVLTKDKIVLQMSDAFKRNGVPHYPTVSGPRGIQIDFCFGCRIYIPPSAGSCEYELVLRDLDSDMTVYKGALKPGDYFISEKRFFVRWGIQIRELVSGEKVLHYSYNAENENVFVRLPVETLGDNLAWFSAAERFQRKHNCKLIVRCSKAARALLEPCYPNIRFVGEDEYYKLTPYAAYTLAVFHHDEENNNAPIDYRLVPLHDYGAYILGIERSEAPPMVAFDKEKREIAEPYVVIATQASGGCKLWHNPYGWFETVEFLKKAGYRVIDIDLENVHGNGYHWNWIPRNAEDFTGKIPLSDRASMIYHADFFIGMGSGLSWLAWCLHKPVVLVSGFSATWNEFYTPYRVINHSVCHGCFGDTRYVFDHHDYFWCPRYKDTPRQWECSRCISAKMVVEAIKRIPAFGEHIRATKEVIVSDGVSATQHEDVNNG